VSIQTGKQAQIAIAPPGSPGGTGGDIYFVEGKNLAPPLPPSVIAFAPSGEELSGFGPPVNTDSCGIATSTDGHIFGAFGNRIFEYVPSANPPVESDLVQTSAVLGSRKCDLAVDSDGNVYIGEGNSPPDVGLYRLDGIGDTSPTKIGPVNPIALAVDSQDGVLLASNGDEVVEYAAGGTATLGAFGAGQLEEAAVAIDPATDEVYATDRSSGNVKVFGPPLAVPAVTAGQPVFSNPAQATLQGSIDPEGIPVTECIFEYGLTTQYEGEASCSALPSTGSGAKSVEANVTGLKTDGVTYHFRLVGRNANGTNSSQDQTFVTPATVYTETATAVTESAATLNGRVFPNGVEYTECDFEYGPISSEGFQSAVDCTPTAGDLPPDSSFHAVAANITNLRANNVTYRYRLKATNSDGKVVVGKTLNFTTSGEPQLSEVRAFDADQHSAKLQALVDPRGFSTAYKIEWGASRNYGQTAAEGVIEPGQGPTVIGAKIDGLSPGVAYHFHVVVSSAAGEVVGLDRQVEALNRCGLPQGRCLELVSPRDPGPTASPGHGANLLKFEQQFQAAKRPGALAYVSEGGFHGATRGAEVFYKSIRSLDQWSTTQISPHIDVLDETQGGHSNSSRNLALSPELTCGVVETNQIIPGMTAAMHQVVEAGGENLYRMNGDGSFTPITTVPPENTVFAVPPNASLYFSTSGMSQDCGRIYFSSVYRYPGTRAVANPGGNKSAYLYEWSKVGLRAVGFVPGPGGDEVPVAAEPGSSQGEQLTERNAVSIDGEQIIFSAERQVGNNPGEVGNGVKGLFVRRGGVTRDVSLSETEVADVSPEYQWATPDGAKVFFTGPAGLTSQASAGGTDLYEYDMAKEPFEHPLTDLSVNEVEGPAEVAGVVGASEDGSRVYFAASGRLIEGKGLSAAENRDAGTFSLYVLDAGGLRFIATVSSGGESAALGHTSKLLVSSSATVTSEVTPEGRYLLFESTTPVTSYDSDGAREVYLFDAGVPSESISCLSCRPDGRPAVRASGVFSPLPGATMANATNATAEPLMLTLVDGSPTVTFASVDPLSSSAVNESVGLYEWSHGQVFLLATESAAIRSHITQGNEGLPGALPFVALMGASVDGSDLYFTTPTPLNWENTSAPYFVYDARIGGGFQQPEPSMAPCRPGDEGSCQASPSSPPAGTSPGSNGFVGPGNPKPKQCKKGQVKKKNKCVKKKAKHKKKHGKKHKKNAKGKKAHGKKHKKNHGKGKRGAGK